MSDLRPTPPTEPREAVTLALDTETVADLVPPAADDVRGGAILAPIAGPGLTRRGISIGCDTTSF